MGAPGSDPQAFADWLKAFSGSSGSSRQMAPVPGSPGWFYNPSNPNDTFFSQPIADAYNNKPMTAAEQAQIGIDAQRLGIEGLNAQTARDKLAQDWAINEANNARLTEISRGNNLKDLITNRNTESVSLAGQMATAAKNAADFSANPRDAVADLEYRRAVGGATPYGSTNNAQFPQLQSALAAKFQSIFGGVGDQFKRAQEFVGSIPPAQYFPGGQYPAAGSPNAASAPAPAQVPASAGAAPAAAPSPTGVPAGAGGGTPPPPPTMQIPGAGPMPMPMASGGSISSVPSPILADGYRPPSSEGGTNMNIHEQAAVVGIKSGHVYATIAENAPEQLIVKPLPSVQRAQKEKDAAAKDGKKALIEGAKRYDEGGTINFGQDPSQFIDQIRKTLGGMGLPAVNGQTLPDLRLFGGDQAFALQNDPDLQDYITSAYSSMGISPKTQAATIARYQPTERDLRLPQVNFS